MRSRFKRLPFRTTSHNVYFEDEMIITLADKDIEDLKNGKRFWAEGVTNEETGVCVTVKRSKRGGQR